MGISHYEAIWVGGEQVPGAGLAGRLELRRPLGPRDAGEALRAVGGPGRQGRRRPLRRGRGYNQTPHDVVLAWLRDVLEMLTGSRHRLCPVELPRLLRHPRLRPDGRRLRGLARPQARPKLLELLQEF